MIAKDAASSATMISVPPIQPSGTHLARRGDCGVTEGKLTTAAPVVGMPACTSGCGLVAAACGADGVSEAYPLGDTDCSTAEPGSVWTMRSGRSSVASATGATKR